MKVLTSDIGGSHIKLLATGRTKPGEVDSGKHIGPRELVEEVSAATANWRYDVISIGYPGLVKNGKLVEDAPNLRRGWVGFDFANAFGRPVRIMNDAAMQALGSYQSKRMLFLGLGTGLGSTLIIDGTVHCLELGDLPFRKGRSNASIWANPLCAASAKGLGRATQSRLCSCSVKPCNPTTLCWAVGK